MASLKTNQISPGINRSEVYQSSEVMSIPFMQCDYLCICMVYMMKMEVKGVFRTSLVWGI